MSETKNGGFIGLASLGFMLALGLVLASFIISGTIRKIKLTDQKISVKGYAEKNISSDLGIWSGEFSVASLDLVSGYNKLEQDLNVVIKYLESKGIKKDDINISSVTTARNYKLNEQGNYTNEFIGYTLTQLITVRHKDVKLIAAISNESTSLIKEGIEFMSNQPSYYYTKINDLKIEMLGEAAKDARIRAEQLAKNSGGEVGSLVSASQGVFQITSKNSTEVTDTGMFDTSSIEKTIKAVITIDYSIY